MPDPKTTPTTPAEAERVDEIVKHTDSGAGASQAEPWEPNVEELDVDGDGG